MNLKFLPFLIVASMVYSCEQRVNSNPAVESPILGSIVPSTYSTPVNNITSPPSVSIIAPPSVVIVPTSLVSPSQTILSTTTPIIVPTVVPSINISPTPTPIPSSTFNPLPKTNIVLFDTSIRPFGVSSATSINGISKLTDILEKENYTVVVDSLDTYSDLDSIDTLFILSPSIDYSTKNIQIIKDFITKGKKVFISGEWGGYGGFKRDSVNTILKDANLVINQDVIKESSSSNYDVNDEHIFMRNIFAHPVTNSVSNIVTYSSASIDLIDILGTESNKAKILVTSSTTGFTIKANYYRSGFLAVSEIGNGKIIVSGDSSFLLDSDTNSNGISNINEGENKDIILNMLKW